MTYNIAQTTKELWPPPYTIRFSKKAKHLSLKIIPQQGLVVVIPYYRKRYNILALLTAQKSWLNKHLDLLQPITLISNYLPKILALNAAKEIWQISYQDLGAKTITTIKPNQQLQLANTLQPKIIKQLLIRWLKQYAYTFFHQQLLDFTQKTKLNYQRLTIRGQQTLWGSCNAQGNISLNFKLLFLPASLASYVILHELCHTKYLNHTKYFWNFLGQFDNNYQQHNAALKLAEQYLPNWLLS